MTYPHLAVRTQTPLRSTRELILGHVFVEPRKHEDLSKRKPLPAYVMISFMFVFSCGISPHNMFDLLIYYTPRSCQNLVTCRSKPSRVPARRALGSLTSQKNLAYQSPVSKEKGRRVGEGYE